MPWTMEEKGFCDITYLETKSLKTVQTKFCSKLNFHNNHHKFQITRWINKSKATG